MSKKSKRRGRGAAAAEALSPGDSRSRRRGFYIAVLSAFAMLAVSVAATRYDPVRRAVGMRPLAIAQATPTPLPLSKEYVYAGGRLVATEEPSPSATPTPTPAGPPPTNFVAKFVPTGPGAGGVRLTWSSPSPAVTGYEVERRHGLAPADFTTIPISGNVETYTDPTGEDNASYLYRIKAVYAGGYSDYTGYDIATAVAFSDDPLQPHSTVIRAAHLTELRRAVRAVRTLAGKGAPVWSYPDPVSSPASSRRAVYLEDVTELRAQLDEALARLDEALGVQTFLQPYPPSPPLGRYGQVYAEHFEQIRGRVR
jgi:hypothetical protein